MALFASSAGQDPVRLHVVQGQVTLMAPTRRLLFCSEWGLRSERDLRLFGRCSHGDGRPAASVSLQVDTPTGAPDGTVSVTLCDVAGTRLLGPLTLRAVAQSAMAASPTPGRGHQPLAPPHTLPA